MAGAPGEDPFEEGQPAAAADLFEEVHFVLFFLDAHVVEHAVVVADAQAVEVLFGAEVLAHVAAFEFAGKEKGHEPANYMAGGRDGLADDVEAGFVPTRDGDIEVVHDGEHFVAVVPLVELDLADGGFFGRVLQRGGVALVGKGGGLLGGVGFLQQVDQAGVGEGSFTLSRV